MWSMAGPARDCLEVTVGGPARRNAEQSRGPYTPQDGMCQRLKSFSCGLSQQQPCALQTLRHVELGADDKLSHLLI